MKLRTDLHISRKLYHISGLILIVVLYAYLKDIPALGTTAANVAISVATALITFLDYVRIRYSKVNRTALTFFRRIMRSDELESLSSMTYLLLGSWVVILFFPAPIVFLSLMMLAFGDPISSMVGVIYGKDKIVGNKSLQGTLAGFTACTMVALTYFWTQNIMVERILLVSLISGIIGATAEILPVGKLDDNLIIPIFSAVMLSGVFYIFGGFS